MLASETSAVYEGLRLERIGVIGPGNAHPVPRVLCASEITIPCVRSEQLVTKAGGDSKKPLRTVSNTDQSICEDDYIYSRVAGWVDPVELPISPSAWYAGGIVVYYVCN